MFEPSGQVDDNANAIIGAALEVHRVLGPGFLESVYEEAMAVELGLRRIPFVRRKSINLLYKGWPVGEGKLDFLVGEALVLELKASEKLLPIHHAQVLSYLKSTRCHLGLLINFNSHLLTQGVRRFIV